jgi:hypothetical protein
MPSNDAYSLAFLVAEGGSNRVLEISATVIAGKGTLSFARFAASAPECRTAAP